MSKFQPPPPDRHVLHEEGGHALDLDKDLIVDYDHIIVDNIERLPIDFLEEEMRSNPDALDGSTRSSKARREKRARSSTPSCPRSSRTTRGCFAARARASRRRCVGEAPREVELQNGHPLVLPARELHEPSAPPQLDGGGSRRRGARGAADALGQLPGQTILTMSQAYKHARLICRPDSDWLTTAQRFEEDDEDEDL